MNKSFQLALVGFGAATGLILCISILVYCFMQQDWMYILTGFIAVSLIIGFGLKWFFKSLRQIERSPNNSETLPARW